VVGILRSRLAVGVAALVIGAGAASAVTYAVADGPNEPETFYACKTSAGKIRAGTIRTGTPPTCRSDRGETVASWSSGAEQPESAVLRLQWTTGGTVYGAPNCYTQQGGGCASVLPIGTEVSIQASTIELSTFDGWSSGPCAGTTNPCRFTLDGDTTVAATFSYVPSPVQVYVDVEVLPGYDDGPWEDMGNFELTITNDIGEPTCVVSGATERRCDLGTHLTGTVITINASANDWGSGSRLARGSGRDERRSGTGCLRRADARRN
jgi:hypothetical protein